MIDPVHRDAEGWWFWDETWADRHGPYPSKKEAIRVLRLYCLWLDGILNCFPPASP